MAPTKRTIDAGIRAAKIEGKASKLADGRGLLLFVSATGGTARPRVSGDARQLPRARSRRSAPPARRGATARARRREPGRAAPD